MAKRDFLKIADLSLAEAREVLGLARVLKAERDGARRARHETLSGRAVAVVMEKPSTRTRVSFEIGIAQLGGYPVVLQTEGTQIARGKPVRDTARVLERYCDAIVYRTFSGERLREMATARVPVVNALSDDGHPVQVLCDVFTIEEALGKSIQGERVAFVGDCSSNMARSFVEAAVVFDFELLLAGPEGYHPPTAELEAARSHVRVVKDPREAVAGVAVVNTDVWTSMGQETENARRLRAFEGWTVNEEMLAGAEASTLVLHCLPAHRGEEIDDATIEGRRSRVWDQAENRLHVQKGLLCWLFGDRR